MSREQLHQALERKERQYRVAKGDPLLETEVADYDKTHAELNEEYQAA